MRLLALSVIAGTLLVGPAIARDHGKPRDLKDVSTIVLHAVHGPSCLLGKVWFGSAPQRDDDAEYWRDFMRAAPVADAHFVIGRAGKVLEIIPIDQIANHTVDVNPVSIGIELVNDGDGRETFPKVQIDSLVTLIRELRRQAPGIKLENIVTHAEIDQRTCPCGSGTFHRRQDTGMAFPLREVREAVVQPGEDPSKPSKLPRLKGPAPAAACR